MEKNLKAGKNAQRKRRSVRFRDLDMLQALVGDVPALVFSESRTGCGLIMIRETSPKVGDDVIVRIGELGKIRGRVRWCTAVDSDVTKIGIEYFD